MAQELKLSVKRAMVLTNLPGTDEVHLTLDLPTGYPNMGYDVSAKICVAHGYGVEWCTKVLGLEAEVIVCK